MRCSITPPSPGAEVRILNNWQLDASRLEGSEAEGMGGEDAPMLHRVHVALAALMGQQ